MVLRTYLAGKIHGVHLTAKNVNYVGSITLSREYLDASGIAEHEAVQVVNVSTGARFLTYVLLGTGAGECILNGGAARLGEVGDRLIVMSFAQSDRAVTPRVAMIDAQNRVERVVQGLTATVTNEGDC